MPIENKLFQTPQQIADWIEQSCGQHPDLFTPSIIAALDYTAIIQQICLGYTPCLSHMIDNNTRQMKFVPMFDKTQMNTLRANISQEYHVVIPDIQIIEEPFIVMLPKKPKKTHTIRVENVLLHQDSVHIKEKNIKHPNQTFEEVFGFTPASPRLKKE